MRSQRNLDFAAEMVGWFGHPLRLREFGDFSIFQKMSNEVNFAEGIQLWIFDDSNPCCFFTGTLRK